MYFAAVKCQRCQGTSAPESSSVKNLLPQVSLSRNLRIKDLSEVELYTLHFYMTEGNRHTF